jgi:hypothetical protein
MKALDATVIKILGHKYTVEYDYTTNIGNPGETNVFPNTIRIGAEYPADTKTEILLHEILEAIINRFNIETQINHDLIVLISEVLHQVLRDNKLEFYEDDDDGVIVYNPKRKLPRKEV